MDVAFATDARYLPWCGVAARSCLDHTGGDLTVHVLHDGALDGVEGADRLAALVADGGGTLELHRVEPSRLAGLPAIDRFGTVVWLRFLLPDLLPDVERVLYLDADTLVTAPLADLFATDMGGAPLGAVVNLVSPSERARLESLGIGPDQPVLNSGVLLLDVPRLRAERATERLLEVARTRAPDLHWPDQDTLNLVFAGRWHRLHPRWNAQNALWSSPRLAGAALGAAAVREARRRPGILHFEGPGLAKPWHALSPHPRRGAWRAVLARTPWAGTPPEDKGALTAVLRLLPRPLRIRLWFALQRRRQQRLVAS